MGLSYRHVDNGDGVYGQLRYKTWDVTWDSSYPTGGELVDASQIGIATIVGINFLAALDAASAGIIPVFDFAAFKLLAMRVAGFTPAGTVAAPTFTGSALSSHAHDLKLISGGAGDGAVSIESTSGPILRIETIGSDQTIAGADSATKGGVIAGSAGTPAGTNSAPAFTGTPVAAGSLIEVANAVSLAAITHRLMFIGS